MIEFRTLGTLDLRDTAEGRTLQSVLSQPKVTAVLAYLALARPRGFHHRDTLLGIFWPETTQERARHSLNQALHVLRRTFGNGVVESRGDDEVGLDFDQLRCDAAEFEAKLEASQRAPALELYGGELLTGLYVPGCPAFERWVDAERARLKDQAVQAALALAEEQEKAGDGVEAVHWVRRAARWVPYDEAVLRRLLGLLRGLGDRAGAIREYEAFERRLAEDLELEPSADLGGLVASIKAENDVPEAVVASQPDVADADPVPAAAPASGTGDRETMESPSPGESAVRRSRVPWVAAAAVSAVGAILIVGLRSDPGESSTATEVAELEPHRVLIMPFRNETGDPELESIGRVAGDWITQGLLRTGLLQVVSGTGTLGYAESWEGADQPGADVALGLAREVGAAHAITGSYVLREGALLFQTQIHRSPGGEVALGLEGVEGDPAEPMAAIEQLRQRVTGSLATLLDPQLESWTHLASQPPSFEVYRLYAEGMDHFMEYEGKEALSRFYEAVALDSTFTAPLIWILYGELNGWGEPGGADSVIHAIERRRDELAPFDRAMLDHQLSRLGGDAKAQYETMKKVVELAPNSEWQAWLAVMALAVNRPREALELLTRMDPERGWIKDWNRYWLWLAAARHPLGEHEAELEDSRRGRQSGWARGHPETADIWFLRLEAWALSALGRFKELEVNLDRQRGTWVTHRRTSRLLLNLEEAILELQAHGYEEMVDAVVPRALVFFDGLTPEQQDEPNNRQSLARVLFAAERWEEARTLYEEILPELSEYQTARVHARLGIVAARLGDPEASMRHYDWLRDWEAKLQAMVPSYTCCGPGGRQWQVGMLGMGAFWRAAIKAHLGDRESAVALLHESFARHGNFAHWLHRRSFLKPLSGYEPFEEFMRPKG
jgi:DNA-binding SARP family transcriptional activator/TolB-like protein